ncbi:FAD-dependent oxidoreductase [Gemmata sp. JC717]|nr:FAD-dependent oxidoreductase [Gemmata algarum]MDY3551343.1 FAD-dependent oxidoreductase [Gemmata algarum]
MCVIGGGIAGLTTAYLLASEGKSVAILEGKPVVAGGETEYTTAHLAWVIDDRFTRLASVRGDEAARLAAKSHKGAISLIEQIAQREDIACDFRRLDGYLFPGSDGPQKVREEMLTLTRLGLEFERVDRVPLPSHNTGPGLRCPDNGQFHPLKYLRGLARAIRRHGGTIHIDASVVKVESGKTCVAHTRGGQQVTADAIVVATNTPFDSGLSLHFKLAAYTTYAVALEAPAGTVPAALFWDTEDPYHYVRGARGADGTELLVVGGEDHKTGQAQDQQQRWERLEAWTRARFPHAGAVKHHWSGQVFETPDGLGLIGRAPGLRDNLYVITGDSGMGMTHGTLGARLVADLILGRTNEFASLYSPSRWMPAALKTLLEENVNLAAQYADWLTGGEVASAASVPPGHGAVLRKGLSKHAVYKDEKGQVHELSAVCPHLGGVVQWNPGEKTWDCPCHGSRFTCTGAVQHGPAVEGLKVIEKK